MSSATVPPEFLRRPLIGASVRTRRKLRVSSCTRAGMFSAKTREEVSVTGKVVEAAKPRPHDETHVRVRPRLASGSVVFAR